MQEAIVLRCYQILRLKYQSIIFSGVLPDKDGVLMMRPMDDVGNIKNDFELYRILLTDSGHYLLPTDNFKDEVNAEKSYLKRAVQKYLNSTLFSATSGGKDNSSTPQATESVFSSSAFQRLRMLMLPLRTVTGVRITLQPQHLLLRLSSRMTLLRRLQAYLSLRPR